jgi:hypothetical protein
MLSTHGPEILRGKTVQSQAFRISGASVVAVQAAG